MADGQASADFHGPRFVENDLQIFLISLSRRNSVTQCACEWKEIFRVLALANHPPSGCLVLLRKEYTLSQSAPRC